MTTDLIRDLRAALDIARSDAANCKTSDRGEPVLITSAVRGVARDYWQEVRRSEPAVLFDQCERLLETGSGHLRLIAFDWAFRARKHYTPADYDRFERWLDRYVDGWGSCDDFCTHAFGHLLMMYPDLQPRTLPWARSDNRWRRRAVTVVLIYGIRKGLFHDALFDVVDTIMLDTDDLVQKGYGWTLKELSKSDPQRVFDYVLAHRAVMPRTAFRYAIEKLPPNWRTEAMQR